MKKSLLVLPVWVLLGCHRNDPSPAEQLPPATQTGANTFGCLLNGQPWTPSGNDGRANYRITYDPEFVGGSLTIRVYRYIGDTHKSQDFIIGGDNINRLATYSFNSPSPYTAYFFDTSKNSPCDSYYNNPGTTTKGQLNITRLDLTQGIISGTFAFTLYQPGCDSVRVTQGRFDKKL